MTIRPFPKMSISRKIRQCRICGCTDNHACPGGCYWVEYDLCNQCLKFAYPIVDEFNASLYDSEKIKRWISTYQKTNVIIHGEIPSEIVDQLKNISETKIKIDIPDRIENLRSLGLSEEEINVILKATPNPK